MDTHALFSGQPLPRGGLSNEEELAECCPKEFLETRNPWTSYVGAASLWGRDETTWKWKSDDPNVQRQQRECFDEILDSHQLKISTKNAIAGWMLSEMLTEVPPPKR